MLIGAQVDERTKIFIDAEAAGGINKGSDEGMSFVPEQAVDNILMTISGMSKRLSSLLDSEAMLARPPSRLEMKFGVKLDSAAVVAVAKTLDEAQFQITVEWRLAR